MIVLFDIDGTLIRTGSAGIRALSRAFLKCLGVADAMGLISPAGKTDPAIIREMCRVNLGRDCTRAEMQAICRTYIDFLREEIRVAQNFRIMPGIPDILRHLAQIDSCIIGLVTGNLEEGARIKLEKPNLFRYFRCGGYGSDSEDRAEVTRIGIVRARSLQASPTGDDQIFLVGDTPFDIECGRKSGVITLAVATGPWKVPGLQAHQPHHLFDDFSDTGRFFQAIGL